MFAISSIRFVFLLLLGLLMFAPSLSQLPPFSPASSTPPPFVGRKSAVAATFYGRTYLFGGAPSTGLLNDIWVSRNDGATWSNVKNTVIPPRFNGALVTVQTVVNNTQLLLYIGGSDGTNTNNNVYISVDGVTFTQSDNATFAPRDAFATAIALPVQDQSGNPLLNGLPALFVLGGRTIPTTGVFVNDVWYTSVKQTHNTAAVISSCPCDMCCCLLLRCAVRSLCLLSAVLYCVLSSGRGIYNYVLATSAAPWSSRCFHLAVAVEGGTRIVVAGGSTDTAVLNDVWIADVGGANWIELLAAAQWSAREAFGLVNIGEKLSIFGGAGAGGDLSDCQTHMHLVQRACHHSAAHWQMRHGHSPMWSVLDADAHLCSCLLLCVSVSLSVWSSLDYGRSARTLTPQTAIGSAPSICPCLCSRR